MRLRRRAPPRPIGCGCAHAQSPVALLPPRPPLALLSTVFQPVRKMPAAVTGCGGPASPRALRPRPRRRRHYGAPSGECAEPRLRRLPLVAWRSRARGCPRAVLRPLRASAAGACGRRSPPAPLSPLLLPACSASSRALPLRCCRRCYRGPALPCSPRAENFLGRRTALSVPVTGWRPEGRDSPGSESVKPP